LLIVPRFSPASAATNMGEPVAVILTLARLRLRTVAPLSMNGNSATGELADARFKSLIV
jgi:hypothetical protein